MSTEEQKNDSFLDALTNSEMPDVSSEKKEEAPKKDMIETERERMKQELKDRQNEEIEQNKAANKNNEKADSTNFDSIKPSSKPVEKEPAPKSEEIKSDNVEENKTSQDNIDKITEQMKISEPITKASPTVKEEESVEKLPEPEFKREFENDWIDHSTEEVKTEEEPEEKTDTPEHTVAKQESIIDKIDVLSSEEVVAANSKKNQVKTNIQKDVEISDNLNKKVVTVNNEIDAQAYESDDEEEEEEYTTVDEINKAIDDNYTDEPLDENEKLSVDFVKPEEQETDTSKEKKPKKTVKKEIKTPFYGGDGQTASFKLRTAKIGKVVRNINIENTEEIDPVDISNKNPNERQDFYLKTVLPILQPSIAVVPLIISGVVVSMTAFGWPDLREIVAYEDKLSELDPNSMRDDEYIHAKNQLFIEKRRKQCDLFYKHITSVTGFAIKPSKEELFGKIIKFPDFPQLFFAAYAASFLKPYTFNIGCPICGAENGKSVVAKDLCFLLNSNIDINRLNYFIQNGTALGQEETAKVYNEFQKEKIVELSTAKYRIKKNLPISSFIYELSIPTVYDALNTMDEISEVFRDIDLSYTNVIEDDEGNIVNAETSYIDSSFGLTSKLLEMRKYLYISSLIVPEVVDENKETKTARIGFSSINDKSAIIQSIYNLTSEDYSTLINDQNLIKLVEVSGIRHAIKGGNCSEPTCGADLGFIQAEPETLFFILARNALRY